MVSEYEYITVAELEAYTAIDYSVIDASFTNTVIEAQISIAERTANDLAGTSYATAPDDVVAATYLMAKRLMNNLIIEFGYGSEGETVAQVVDDIVLGLLKETSAKYDYKLKTGVTDRFWDL